MIEYIKNKLKSWSEEGIKFFYAYDGSSNQKSTTLFFVYITFWLAVVGSIVVYYKPELLSASINSTVFWVVSFVMYRLRRLDKVKLDLDDKSIELSGDSNEPK